MSQHGGGATKYMRKAAFQHTSRWNIWWQWTLASTAGVFVAVALYAILPRALTNPLIQHDYDYVAMPWRYLLIYGSIYGAVSSAQWWVLRYYVADAWRWIAVTTGCAALLFPASMWLFHTIGLEGIAMVIWSAGIDFPYGFGGHLFAIIGQWLVFRRWTRVAWLWLVLAPVIGLAVLIGVVAFLVRLEPWFGANNRVFDILWGTLYYAISGIIVAMLLTHRSRQIATSTASVANAERPLNQS
jgi:hypothetical protein